ncbi:MAG: M28 family peptidase [Pseudomonadota bacterium]
MTEFASICDCGGRLCGTPSEAAAIALLADLGRLATGVPAIHEPVAYEGWRAVSSRLTGPDGQVHPLHPLVRSAPTPVGGIRAEVIDLGRGTAEEFAAHAPEIPGRIALVRHELMFAPGTIHRRQKIGMAAAAGAAAFLIAGPEPGSVVTGSGRGPGDVGIPAAGIAPETAEVFARTARGHVPVQMDIATEEAPAISSNLVFDIEGKGPGRVVLCAHLDGHDLAESAIDNASGLAVALEVVRRVLPRLSEWRRGLRLAFFSVEEWALTGSAQHVAALSASDRAATALAINLDAVAGGAKLTAMTSGFDVLEHQLLLSAERARVPLRLFRPHQRNSDHAVFAEAGIPAFRLVAGFGENAAATRAVLTEHDRRELVRREDMERAADLTTEILMSAMTADAAQAAAWRQRVGDGR